MAKATTTRANKVAFDKSTLLAAIKTKEILTPHRLYLEELQGDIFIRRMTVGERDDYFLSMKDVKFSGKPEAFVFAAVTEDGEPMFNGTKEDIELVASIPPSVTDKVVDKFIEINLMNKTGSEKEVKEDLKNS